MSDKRELVTITVDDVEIQVPEGMNLIEAAKIAGSEIPYYCYHPDLSIAGNCRMCQVHVEGMRKLEIGCNTGARDGMVVRTHKTSQEVADAQRATLEFLLINHPLDCTVCDQAGHCKLQDYYYQYNAQASRFAEKKVNQVKAEPLGPEVMYDGERCIVCTRCVRFCEEVTETAELGVFNRGDRSVIGIHKGTELENPLSGTVVDLCPVGALTHKHWRFNTRIWYTKEESSICPGCSSGCNVQAYSRDGQIVQIKARHNPDVNKEWLCDEGRYGFDRFQPEERLEVAFVRLEEKHEESSFEDAIEAAKKITSASGELGVFLSPFLTLEEVWLSLEFAEKFLGVSPSSGKVAMQLRQRSLSNVEAVLISPDYAPNARAASLFGVGDSSVGAWRESIEKTYDSLLKQLRNGSLARVLLIGEDAILRQDVDESLGRALWKLDHSVAIASRAAAGEGSMPAQLACRVVLPERTVNEKSGLMINQDGRLQRLRALLDPPEGTYAAWNILKLIGGTSLLPAEVNNERSLFKHMIKECSVFGELSLMQIGDLGIDLDKVRSSQKEEQTSSGAGARA